LPIKSAEADFIDKGFRDETFDFSIAEILGGLALRAYQRVSERNLEFQLC